MTQYAHSSELEPRALPAQWVDPATGNTIMGLSLLSDAELAALGWYPVRREALNAGASGWGEMTLVDGEYVIPSLPADPVAANRAKWSVQASQRAQAQARKVLAELLPDNPSKTDIDARISALRTLQGV